MTAVVAVIGHQGTGKTRLIEQLIPVLLERGYRVGTVKHAPDLEEIDTPGSDSSRHRAAGAEQSLVVGEIEAGLFWERDPEMPIGDEIEQLFADYDLVLVEGFKRGPFPKIEVWRRVGERSVEPLAGSVRVMAVVTRERVALPDGVFVVPPNDPETVADFLERTVLSAP
jgi:molybdopterin-guanine dinucleotide biosynthesis adapter protein